MANVDNHDLRSGAKEFQRVKNQTAKWSHGSRSASGRWNHCHDPLGTTVCSDCNRRPAREQNPRYTALLKRTSPRNNAITKKAFRGGYVGVADDVDGNQSDSSGNFDVDDTAAAPELSEVMYSFDAPTGPSRGNDVLSFAVNQAVQRFENNETEKIVKKEYDFVLDGKDEPESFVADADDDFEFIDDSHLK